MMDDVMAVESPSQVTLNQIRPEPDRRFKCSERVFMRVACHATVRDDQGCP
jgi:hypothetical protein